MARSTESPLDEGRRVSELSAFLASARSRISPDEVGFSGRERRRVPGLRQEEVAELVDVSAVWYGRLERGLARFSLPALERLASVLRLTAVERRHLFHLARPEIARASGGAVRDNFSGECSRVAEFARLAKRLGNCSTTREVSDALAAAIYALNERPGIAFAVRRFSDSSCRFESLLGEGADALHGYLQPANADAHVRDALDAGRFVYEYDLSSSTSPEMRDRVDLVKTLAYYTQAMVAFEEFPRMQFGFASFEPHQPDAREIEVSHLMIAMTELALYPSSRAL